MFVLSEGRMAILLKLVCNDLIPFLAVSVKLDFHFCVTRFSLPFLLIMSTNKSNAGSLPAGTQKGGGAHEGKASVVPAGRSRLVVVS